MKDSIFNFPRDLKDRTLDAHFGVARFSGFWTQVHYTSTYATAAHRLYLSAKQTAELDEIAVPLLFLQRHTVELALKDFISVLAALLDRSHPDLSNAALEVSQKTHSLPLLHARAKELASAAEVGDLPNEFGRLIAQFEEFEKGAAERARFPSVKTRDRGRMERSLPNGGDISEELIIDTAPKVAVPVGHIMADLLTLIDRMRLDNEEEVFHDACHRLNSIVMQEEFD